MDMYGQRFRHGKLPDSEATGRSGSARKTLKALPGLEAADTPFDQFLQ
jgi:hypothetical protein